MFAYGAGSQARLEQVHPDLRRGFYHAIRRSPYDFTIVWGFRDEANQEQALRSGNSTKRWPNSEHNAVDEDGKPCSNAVDFAPWCQLPDGSKGIPWKDTHAFAVIGGIILSSFVELEIPVIYGGDWDMDGLTTDQLLMDWGHIERIYRE